MRLKRIVLLGTMAVAAGTAVVFSMSAAADIEGPYWYDDREKIDPTPEAPKAVTPTGTLMLTVGPGKIKIGPCENIELKGSIYNGPAGEGVITGGSFNSKCPTQFAGCEVEASTLQGLPWEITLTEPTNVEVTGVKIENHFSKECEKFGLPLTSTVSGTVTGVFDGLESELELEESGDLQVGAATATLDGEFEFGTEITIH